MGRFVNFTFSSMDPPQSEFKGATGPNYNPRKCCVTNCLLTSKDHASVQLNVGQVDQHGIYTGDYQVYCLSGAIRRQGEADNGLNRLAVEAGFMNARVLK